MTRSVLRPIRTRRVLRNTAPASEAANDAATLTPGTRKTLAAIGSLWVSFAVSSAGGPLPRETPAFLPAGSGSFAQ